MTVTTESILCSLNPATGEPVGEVPITPVSEIPALVSRSRQALAGWRKTPLAERVRLLLKVGEDLQAAAEEIGTLLTQEMGKPLQEGIGEVSGCASSMPAELEEITAALQPDQMEDSRTRSTVYHDPFGVCAAITPWNFPVGMPHDLVVPALAAGNTVLFKPSEETPLSADAYARILNRHLPPDVLQVIHGADDQGKALVSADVDLIAFIGSRETGKKILGSASSGLKRVILELGGKDPMLVLKGADLDKAADFAVLNSFRNAGQVCVSTERIFVDETVADQFEQLMAEKTQAVKVGAGTEEGVGVGPMINERQRSHVLRQIQESLAEGAHMVAGSEDHPPRFVLPTVLTGVTPDMGIMRDETFGPVACISRFSQTDEAVRLANDTPYGLGAVVFGEEKHALEVARELDAGMIGVNKSCGGASGTPWVGAKESGYGFHSSTEGHRQFTQARVVSAPKS